MMSHTNTSRFKIDSYLRGEMIRLNLLRGNQPFSQCANVIAFKFITYADISSFYFDTIFVTVFCSTNHPTTEHQIRLTLKVCDLRRETNLILRIFLEKRNDHANNRNQFSEMLCVGRRIAKYFIRK